LISSAAAAVQYPEGATWVVACSGFTVQCRSIDDHPTRVKWVTTGRNIGPPADAMQTSLSLRCNRSLSLYALCSGFPVTFPIVGVKTFLTFLSIFILPTF